MGEQPNYYAVIPAEIRYDKNLSLLEKMLFAEITALSNKEGFCWATNKYFAELYDKNSDYISRVINRLSKKGYLTIKIDEKSGNNRRIYIGGGVYRKSLYPIDKKSIPIDKKVKTYLEKCQPNSISNNINTIYSELLKFYNQTFNKEMKSTESFSKNLDYWLKTYSIDEIKKAIVNGKNDKYWQDKLTLIILFRRKNTNKEDVDYIGTLLNKKTAVNKNIGNLKGIHYEPISKNDKGSKD